jgi:hypothetical protein
MSDNLCLTKAEMRRLDNWISKNCPSPKYLKKVKKVCPDLANQRYNKIVEERNK